MHSGRLVVAQRIGGPSLGRSRSCVERHNGNCRVRSCACRGQPLCMASAQLTARQRWCDNKVGLRAYRSKLDRAGIRGCVARNTLANPKKLWDARIDADLARIPIGIALPQCADENFAWDLDNRVYAWDASTIDRGLSVAPWARFRPAKTALILSAFLDLRGHIPTFIPIPDGRLYDDSALDPPTSEPGAIYVMDGGCQDCKRLFGRAVEKAFGVSRAQSSTR